MDLIELLQRLPLWALGILLSAGLVSFSLVGLAVFRRHVYPWLGIGSTNSHYIAPLMQASLLLYSLVAALTAVGVWTRYSDGLGVASAEATAITMLWRDLAGYPEPESGAMREVLRGYTDQVINDAWPKLQLGEIPNEGVEWMDRLQTMLYAFEPVTEGQKIVHAEALDSFNGLIEQRRLRLDAAQGGLPGVFWFVLLGGAGACIVLCLFFHDDNAHAQTVMMSGLALSLAMVLLVIFALDTPFTGDMGVGPDSYQLIYDQHMR